MESKVLVKNYFFIGLNTITRIIINFVYTRLVITQYGSAVNGFFSSVISIIGYLNLAEAGVGFATTYALYKPINEKNYNKCNSILAFTNNYFKKIAVILTVILMLISLIYPYLLSDFPNKCLGTYLIIVYGIVTLTEYFYDGKYKLLFNADQKLYIVNAINTVSYIISFGMFIVFCLFHKNFFVVSSTLLLGILVRIICTWKAKGKYYPWIDFKVKPDKSIWKYSNDLFVQKLATLAFSSTDIILISFFVGLKEVSVYSTFNMILNGLSNCMIIITESPVHILGKLFAEKDLNSAKNIYYKYEHLCIMVTTIFVSCWFLLIKSFISLYTTNVNDINYNNQALAILMGIYFILTYYRTTAATTVNVTGRFDNVKKVYMIEAIVNIVLSVILVFPMGITGVLLGSIIAKTYSFYRIISIAYHEILKSNTICFWRKIAANVFVVTLYIFIGRLEISYIPNYFQFIGYGCISVIAAGLITLIVNLLLFKEDTKSVIREVKHVIRC